MIEAGNSLDLCDFVQHKHCTNEHWCSMFWGAALTHGPPVWIRCRNVMSSLGFDHRRKHVHYSYNIQTKRLLVSQRQSKRSKASDWSTSEWSSGFICTACNLTGLIWLLCIYYILKMILVKKNRYHSHNISQKATSDQTSISQAHWNIDLMKPVLLLCLLFLLSWQILLLLGFTQMTRGASGYFLPVSRDAVSRCYRSSWTTETAVEETISSDHIFLEISTVRRRNVGRNEHAVWEPVLPAVKAWKRSC